MRRAIVAKKAPLTLEEAAEVLGWEEATRARKLRRFLLRSEATSGQRVLIRNGVLGRGVRYSILLSALRDAFPEMFDRRALVVDAIREELDERDEEIAERLDTLEARTDRLDRDAEAAKKSRVEARVFALERVTKQLGLDFAKKSGPA